MTGRGWQVTTSSTSTVVRPNAASWSSTGLSRTFAAVALVMTVIGCLASRRAG
jgi:hypothetical protein